MDTSIGILFAYCLLLMDEIGCMEMKCVQQHWTPVDLSLSGDHLTPITNLTISDSSLASLSVSGHLFRPICLDFSHNELQLWPVINCSEFVEFLNLSWNLLDHFDETVLSGLSSMKVLDLSHNRISYIDLPPLLHLKSLNLLFLQGNTVHIFSSLKAIPSLDTVVLSVEHWYAINTVDFGHYPVNVLLEGNPKLKNMIWKCSTLSNKLYCKDVVLKQFHASTVPANVCLACFICGTSELYPEGTPTEAIGEGASEECRCRSVLVICLSTAVLVFIGTSLFVCTFMRKYYSCRTSAAFVVNQQYSCERLSRSNLHISPIPSINAQRRSSVDNNYVEDTSDYFVQNL